MFYNWRLIFLWKKDVSCIFLHMDCTATIICTLSIHLLLHKLYQCRVIIVIKLNSLEGSDAFLLLYFEGEVASYNKDVDVFIICDFFFSFSELN